MRPFLISCVVAIIFAVGAYFTLNAIQEPVDIAYTTSAVRL